jgi:hypothetical protein
VTQPPAFIDYEGDAPEPEKRWGSKQLQTHWNRLLVTYHSAGGFLWGIKEITLLKKLMSAYSPEDLSLMMVEYMATTELKRNYFYNFYQDAPLLHSKITQQSEGYSWS